MQRFQSRGLTRVAHLETERHVCKNRFAFVLHLIFFLFFFSKSMNFKLTVVVFHLIFLFFSFLHIYEKICFIFCEYERKNIFFQLGFFGFGERTYDSSLHQTGFFSNLFFNLKKKTKKKNFLTFLQFRQINNKIKQYQKETQIALSFTDSCFFFFSIFKSHVVSC